MRLAGSSHLVSNNVNETDQMVRCPENLFVSCTICLVYLHLLEQKVTLATAGR